LKKHDNPQEKTVALNIESRATAKEPNMIYKSEAEEILYQIRPKRRKRSHSYTESQWHTTDGAIYEANKLSRCVEWARRYYFSEDFTFFVSINITQYLTAQKLKNNWQFASRYLRDKGVVALWVVEISRRSNHFNYHFLVRSRHSDLKAILKKAFRQVRTNMKVETYNPSEGRYLVRYMTKAKVPLYRDGKLVTEDRWRRKRVLFRQELKITKHGTIGNFWTQGKNRKVIWSEITNLERSIREGLLAPDAEDYAEDLHELIQGYFSLKRVRRSVGYFGIPADRVPNDKFWDSKVV
jgi:hypothetical protein